MAKQYDVFISYAHDDTLKKIVIEEALTAAGMSVFSDNGGIDAGDEWITRLAEAICGSSIFLAIISDAYCRSQYSMMEFRLAATEYKDGQIKIVPYLVDGVMPHSALPEMKMFLSTLQYVSGTRVPPGKELADVIQRAKYSNVFRKEISAPPKALENHCINHPDRGVAARCVDCGKNLCADCASKYTLEKDGKHIPLCDDCANRRNDAAQKHEAEAKAEASKRKNRKILAFFLKTVLAGIIFAACINLFPRTLVGGKFEPWEWCVMVMLSFIPFGFRVAGASYDPRNHPDNNPGCLLMLIIGSIGGIFLFLYDLITLFIPEEYSDNAEDSRELPLLTKEEINKENRKACIIGIVCIAIIIASIIWAKMVIS